MKSMGIIFQFEYLNYAKKKAYIILTAVIIIAVAGILFWPRISGFLFEAGGDGESGEVNASLPEQILLIDETGKGAENMAAIFNEALTGTGYILEASRETTAQAEARVESGEYSGAIILQGELKYKRIVRALKMYDNFGGIFSEVLKKAYQSGILASLDMDSQQIEDFINAEIETEIVNLSSGRDQFSSFIFAYALIFALYFVILMYGQFVAASVAMEKSTRAMELLITSARPRYLMFGKVFGAGLAGLTQFVLIFGAAFLFYLINSSYYEENVIIQAIFSVHPSLLVYAVVFLLLGFFIYAFLYAALASLVSRMEELSTTTMPVMFLFVAAFIIAMFSMAGGQVDSILMKICSYIPLTSPLVMFVRIAMGEPPVVGIVISIAILAGSTVGIGLLAASIYRLGVLLYGTAPKPREIIRMLKAEKMV